MVEEQLHEGTGQTAHLKVTYSRESSLYLVYISVALVFCLILSSLVIFRIYTSKPAPQYLGVALQEGRLKTYNLPALDQPSLSLPILSNWIANAALQTHTFDFNNIDKVIAQSKMYFTDNGYSRYLEAVTSFRDTVVSEQFIVSCIVKEAPVIKQNFVTENKYYWEAEIPIVLTYTSASVPSKREERTLKLIINRVDSTVNPFGISISNFRSVR